MASYTNWNQALVSYFTSGVPRGTKIYLSVDDDILERIGREFDLTLTAGNYGEDFCVAVRKQVIDNRQVNLAPLRSYGYGVPKGIAFLGATVLAAYQMGDEERTSELELKYFPRLQEVLDLRGDGRPPGMKPGDEKPLWEDWNQWLKKQGFLESAHLGTGRKDKYINYPISQTILRYADKNQLLKLFYEKQWKKHWDAQTLFSFVRSEASSFPQHLRNLLTEESHRHEAVAEAIHEVYEQWQDEGYPQPGTRGKRTGNRNIFAGLYRIETDPFLGRVDYYLYPKQGRGQQIESMQVQCQNTVHTLRIDQQRAGWYMPGWPMGATELNNDTSYRIISPANLGFLILPSRDFWILVPDSDNPDSGEYASWGRPSLDVPFILLCKQKLCSDIECLRNAGLLECSDSLISVFNNNSQWVEFHQCKIVSLAWDKVFINNQELKEALQPNVSLYISFSGGLRDRNVGAWIEGHSPEVTIFSRSSTAPAKLQVTRLSDNNPIMDDFKRTKTPISVNFPSPGHYLVKATCGSESTKRYIQIIGWSELSIQEPKEREWIPINSGYRICGSLIEPVS